MATATANDSSKELALNLDSILRKRHFDLVQLRKQSDGIISTCKMLLKPWNNRDSQGKLAISKGSMKTLSKEDKQMDTPSSAKTDSVIDTTCESIALDMKIVDEALAKARRARMIETKVKGQKQKSSGTTSTAETKVKTSSTSTSNPSCSVLKKKSTLLASQVYGSSQIDKKKMKRLSSSSSTVTKKTDSSRGRQGKSSSVRVHTGIQSSRTKHNKADIGVSRSASNLLKDSCPQKPSKGDLMWDTEVLEETPELYDDEKHPRLQSGQTAASGVDVSSKHLFTVQQHGTGVVNGRNSIQKVTSSDCNSFVISEHGQRLSMPNRYLRLRKAGKCALSELEAMTNDQSGEDFMKRISQSELDRGLFASSAERDQYISLMVFRNHCIAFQGLLDGVKTTSTGAQTGEQGRRTATKESLKEMYDALERMWSCVSQKKPVCSPACHHPGTSTESFVYSSVQEWKTYCQLKHEVLQLKWEIEYLKVCLESLQPKLKELTSIDKQTIQTIQSIYSLFGLPVPVFLCSPDF